MVKLKNCWIGTKIGVVVDIDPVIMIVVTKRQKDKKAKRQKDKKAKRQKYKNTKNKRTKGQKDKNTKIQKRTKKTKTNKKYTNKGSIQK